MCLCFVLSLSLVIFAHVCPVCPARLSPLGVLSYSSSLSGQVSTEHGKVHVQDVEVTAKDDGDTDQGRLSTSGACMVPFSFLVQIEGCEGQWMPRAGVGLAAPRDELP